MQGLISMSTLRTFSPAVFALGLEFGNEVWGTGKKRFSSVQFGCSGPFSGPLSSARIRWFV